MLDAIDGLLNTLNLQLQFLFLLKYVKDNL